MYKNLPAELQSAIFSAEFIKTIQDIGKKYNLYIDKVGELSSQTVMVMTGATHPGDFIGNLEKRLGVPREKAAEIAQDVNQRIFSKVRESLKKIHNIDEAEEDKSKIQISKSKMPEQSSQIKPTPPETLPVEEPIASKEPPPPSSPQSVFEKKLETEIHQMPKETKEVSEEQLKEIQIKQAQKYAGKDPYREPAE